MAIGENLWGGCGSRLDSAEENMSKCRYVSYGNRSIFISIYQDEKGTIQCCLL